jgi:hypothetical protein
LTGKRQRAAAALAPAPWTHFLALPQARPHRNDNPKAIAAHEEILANRLISGARLWISSDAHSARHCLPLRRESLRKRRNFGVRAKLEGKRSDATPTGGIDAGNGGAHETSAT